MKKFIVSCAALLLTVVCMASSISCSGGNSAQRDGKSYKMENTGLTINPVIPTSKDGKEQWKYIKANPGDGWNAKDFDDSSWKSGYGAFGTRGTDNTSWTTTDIWLRKEFTLDGCTQQQNIGLRP